MIERRPNSENLFPTKGDQIPSPTGTYTVLGLLGSGGSARVYLAERLAWDEPAAQPRLCTLKLAASEQEAERLVAEGTLLAPLQHPGVPRFIELFDWQSATCLAAEHRPGRTLDQLQQDNGGRPLPLQEVVGWAIRVCDILAYLHSQPAPVVHRDVKPQNLLLTDGGDIVLLDFGASRLFDARKPGDTIALGSPEYAAPEQLQGRGQSGPQADLWGLGATCFRLLTGSGPDRLFTFPPLREVLPTAPTELEAVLVHSLQYQPERRFADAAAMRSALEGALVALGNSAAPSLADQDARPLIAASAVVGGVTLSRRLRKAHSRPLGGFTPASTAPATPAAAPIAAAAPPAAFPAQPVAPAALQGGHGDRLVLLVSAFSPLVSALIVAITIYVALTARGPLGLTQQPLGVPTGPEVTGPYESGLANLDVVTEPAGAVVQLDGVPLQNHSPMRLTRLAAGSHRLRLTLPGYSPVERTIDVTVGAANELSVLLQPLTQLTLGLLSETEGSGAWLDLPASGVYPDGTDRLALRLSSVAATGAAGANSGPVTLQVVLRSNDGTARTLYSGPYTWGQVRPLWPGRLSPGTYTIEVAVVGVDLSPLASTAHLKVVE